eukprot:515488-Prymnesium_polylepis.1
MRGHSTRKIFLSVEMTADLRRPEGDIVGTYISACSRSAVAFIGPMDTDQEGQSVPLRVVRKTHVHGTRSQP